MKKLGLLFLGVVFCGHLFGATLYVDLNSAAPAAPFNSWASASTNIQAAVNAAAAGDTIVITNGHYLLDTEIVVTNAVTLQSVNGPEATIVDGQGSVRCFNLGESACTLSGLTITNGYTAGYGGGVYCEAFSGIVIDCVLVGNSADTGGGGINGGTVNECTISGNQTTGQGGGVAGSKLNNSVISKNTAFDGGGISRGYRTICIAKKCIISGNMAVNGGGAHMSYLYNCTVTGNSADIDGGTYGGETYNSIIWYNSNEGRYNSAEYIEYGGPIMHSCSPYLTAGVDGNMTNAPMFVDAANGDYHLLSTSPCIGAGNAEYAAGTDIDGEVWLNPPSMGCYEYYAANAVYVAVNGDDANDGLSWATAKATIQAGVDAQNEIGGVIYVSSGTYALTNEIVVNKAVVIQSINGPEATIVDGQSSVRCFNLGESDSTLGGLTITNGYTTEDGGGVYCNGTTVVFTNCIVSGNSAYNGGGMHGGTAIDCTISNNTAENNGGGIYNGILANCRISNNSAHYGGGVAGSTANNCLIIENTAEMGGGGVRKGTSNNCTISDNSAHYAGGLSVGTANNCMIKNNSAISVGGVSGSFINNCTITGNTAADTEIGVVYGGVVNNCIVWNNVPSRLGELHRAEFYYSCFPSAENGVDGNTNRDPLFVDAANDDYHLLSNSPCIGAGSVEYAIGTDIDGKAWLNPPSMGCYAYYAANAVYVAVNGDDANDGLSWATAKATIQAGVDAQNEIGGVIYVSSGTYALTNEIVVNKAVVIQSINGPETTIVDGQGSVRCFNLVGSACTLSGLTITNGYAGDEEGINGGGVLCSDNLSVLNNCFITGNRAYNIGGGIYNGFATNCVISGNSAEGGGGMAYGTAANCIICDNTAFIGGGVYIGEVNNSAIYGNSASAAGGGVFSGTANNCTIVGNTAIGSGGGMCGWMGGSANNCIIWYNTSGDGTNIDESTTALYSCCPDVTHGVDGNITNAPMLISAVHLAGNSPCIGVGSAEYAAGKDIDGDAWLNPPAMGCDEFIVGDIAPSAKILGSEFRLAEGFQTEFSAEIAGTSSMYVWDFGDGSSETNSLYTIHAWNSLGTYNMILTVYPEGVSVTQVVEVVDQEMSAVYVAPDGNDANDGLSWSSAKATLQAGVDAQDVLGGFVWVSNGTYALNSEIVVDRPITIQGIAGPESTVVDGQGAVRCFHLTATECIISGLTITNGYASSQLSGYGGSPDGGGIYCLGKNALVTNCIVSGNKTDGSGGGIYDGAVNGCTISGNTAVYDGGGMMYSTANDCVIRSNAAAAGGGIARGEANNCVIAGNVAEYGGGVDQVTANHCTITRNVAQNGGGVYASTVRNSIIWYNEAMSRSNVNSSLTGHVVSSCSPDLIHGVDGNMTNAPMLTSASHLAVDSPCIGAGNVEYTTGTDIDGEAWLNPPSMGCDEYSEVVSGPVSVKIDGVDNVLLSSAASLSAEVEGAASLLTWDFDDGTVVSNVLSLDHAWTQLGSYDVVLTAYNNTWPGGVSSTQTIEVLSAESSAVYVAVGGDDANDGLSWATAKATIQAGVDAQGIADGWILVSNGTYAVTNEIAVNKSVVIRGVNGPDGTIIDGSGVARCLNLGYSACVIDSLTITNGYTDDDGAGIYCRSLAPVITNCIITGNSIGQYGGSGGGIYYGTANNCIITNNFGYDDGGGMSHGTANGCTISGNSTERSGGGMFRGVANYCTISDNFADEYGGGLHDSIANHCTITENSADIRGGGGDDSTVNHCTITGNTANDGGGINDTTANHCTISENEATRSGGGISGGTANNCLIVGNYAGRFGGGALYKGTANNCTIIGNTSGREASGLGYGTANNCIILGNGLLIDGTTVSNSCSPYLTSGVDGNITNAPAFVDAANGDYRLLSTSPCINQGDNAAVVGTVDLDGLPRIAGYFVDMGAYEFQGPFSADMDEDDLPDEWERTYFTSDAEVPAGNADLDGLSNWDEYIAGTDPSDAVSCLAITNCCLSDGFTVEWGPSVTGRLYRVVWSESLTNSTSIVLQDNIVYPQSSYTDTEYDDRPAGFYRVEVRMEE